VNNAAVQGVVSSSLTVFLIVHKTLDVVTQYSTLKVLESLLLRLKNSRKAHTRLWLEFDGLGYKIMNTPFILRNNRYKKWSHISQSSAISFHAVLVFPRRKPDTVV